jgi:hypothetical protein
MVGLAVTVGLYTLGYLLPAPFNAVPGRFGPWLLPGLIPLAVGLALVASYYLSPPRPEQPKAPGDDTAAPDGEHATEHDRPATDQDGTARGRRRPGWHVVDHDDGDAVNG